MELAVRMFTSDGSWEGVGELLHVFGLCLRLVLLPSENNLNSTLRKKERACVHTVRSNKGNRERDKQKELVWLYLGAHDGNLSCGPGVVHISSQVFGAHHVIGSSVSLGYTNTESYFSYWSTQCTTFILSYKCLLGTFPHQSLLILSTHTHTHTFLVMMVIFGTVASAKAYSSLAPCLMMPPYSWAVPVDDRHSSYNERARSDVTEATFQWEENFCSHVKYYNPFFGLFV